MRVAKAYDPRLCETCERKYQPIRENQRFCCRACQNKYKRQDFHAPENSLQISRITRGAVSELIVCADLLEKGYEVFRAVTSQCSCDAIALKDGVCKRVEIKSARVEPISGKVYLSYSKLNPNKYDVLAICMLDGSVLYEGL